MRRIIDDFFPKDITTILNQPEKLLLDNGRFFLGSHIMLKTKKVTMYSNMQYSFQTHGNS